MHSEQPESEFARILAGIQERTGLSHQRIADAAGVDRSQVWRWVRGGSNPGYEPVRKLAAWLIAERPEVADAAAALLPAAGYETPPSTRQDVFPDTTPEMEAAMDAYIDEVRLRVELARRHHPSGPLSGREVFPLDARGAVYWDGVAGVGFRQEEGVIRGTAALLALADQEAAAEREAGTAAGLRRRHIAGRHQRHRMVTACT